MAAVVGVMNQLSAGVASPESYDQRGDDEVGCLAFAHGPSHDAAVVVEITGRGEVWCRGGEVAFRGGPDRRPSGRRPGAIPPGVRADEAVVAHQARHPVG
jgi:hypothetical protein